MEWIRDNYEKVALAAVALLLLAFSVLILNNVSSFNRTFAGIRGQVERNTKIPMANLAGIQATAERAAHPAKWEWKGRLFVSRPYILKNGVLFDPTSESNGDSLYPPVPNKWIMDNDLDILDSNVLATDSDLDGFSNLDEWDGKTNPHDKNSHPGYLTKLRLARIDRKPFRILFASYTEGTFQINTLDIRQPSQFLKIGDQIAGTPFKIVSFEAKKLFDARVGGEKDVSELVIEHLETAKKIVLVVNVIVDSPDSFAVFRYLWNKSEIKKKKDEEFSLEPEPDVTYKLIDIKPGQAVLENLKTNKKTTLRIEP